MDTNYSSSPVQIFPITSQQSSTEYHSTTKTYWKMPRTSQITFRTYLLVWAFVFIIIGWFLGRNTITFQLLELARLVNLKPLVKLMDYFWFHRMVILSLMVLNFVMCYISRNATRPLLMWITGMNLLLGL